MLAAATPIIATAIAVAQPATLRFAEPPYAAVRCPHANSIACDRISVAIWPLRKPARLVVTITGRRITMQPPTTPAPGAYWQGTLNHAGLLGPGPLHVTPDAGRYRWIGKHPVTFWLSCRADYPDHTTAQTRLRVTLRPGWG